MYEQQLFKCVVDSLWLKIAFLESYIHIFTLHTLTVRQANMAT